MKNFPTIDKFLLTLFGILGVTLGGIFIFRQDIKIPDFISTGVILFGIQSIISAFFSQRIEKYKDEITNKSKENNHVLELRLESFKSDLNLTLTKQSKLHETRLGVISELYGKIVKLHQKMECFDLIVDIFLCRCFQHKYRLNYIDNFLI